MTEPSKRPLCGIVMPISAVDGCTESHWSDVLDILNEAIQDAGYDGNLVSNADDVGIIHKRIIQNLYDNPIVVCDVSGKNPNVMFELGMRLAFDKPTVIVKDDRTSYSFDTSAIEHLEYPRDLRFATIVEFKQKLAEKIAATHSKATTDHNYTTFLKHFGEFTVAKLDKKELSGQEFILEELRSLRTAMVRLEQTSSVSLYSEGARSRSNPRSLAEIKADINICMERLPLESVEVLLKKAREHPDVIEARILERSPNHRHLLADVRPGANKFEIEALLSPESRRRKSHKWNGEPA